MNLRIVKKNTWTCRKSDLICIDNAITLLIPLISNHARAATYTPHCISNVLDLQVDTKKIAMCSTSKWNRKLILRPKQSNSNYRVLK